MIHHRVCFFHLIVLALSILHTGRDFSPKQVWERQNPDAPYLLTWVLSSFDTPKHNSLPVCGRRYVSVDLLIYMLFLKRDKQVKGTWFKATVILEMKENIIQYVWKWNKIVMQWDVCKVRSLNYQEWMPISVQQDVVHHQEIIYMHVQINCIIYQGMNIPLFEYKGSCFLVAPSLHPDSSPLWTDLMIYPGGQQALGMAHGEKIFPSFCST